MARETVIVTSLAAIVTALGLVSARVPSKASSNSAERVRQFEFEYSFTVKNLSPSMKRVRIWFPMAASDAHQTVTVRHIASAVPVERRQDPEYANRMFYAEIDHPKEPEATFAVTYEITRREYSQGDFQSLMRYNDDPSPTPASTRRFLEPDRLVPIGGKLRALADESTRGKQGTVQTAHALYDYVFHNLRYDKSGTGWGRGDSLWACDSKHGNCTDFHSLFISMMRAERIPARFEIGFPLPENARQGTIPGYHCWAEFYINRAGWVPVDISEAWQTPAKHDYFFGTIDANRVRFSVGRDLTLSPPQQGPPLNYFVYPYVERDGQAYDSVDRNFFFQDRRGS